MWEVLRRQVEERPGGVAVTVGVRRDRLDLFLRVSAPHLAEQPDPDPEAVPAAECAADRVPVRLVYPSVRAARQLLCFADQAEVIDPPEVRAELREAAASVEALYRGAGPAVSPASGGGRS
ncbi:MULTISPECIES: hypothetical protein [unclassified Streptomyces]|uniref:hypothetical protein n=1 Tax=unclassified Streptomyces TaxID=2593676 RepID=UPI003D735F35